MDFNIINIDKIDLVKAYKTYLYETYNIVYEFSKIDMDDVKRFEFSLGLSFFNLSEKFYEYLVINEKNWMVAKLKYEI
jgi:hypothetical protein